MLESPPVLAVLRPHHSPGGSTGAGMTTDRHPASSLQGCERILVLGRTGSGKTTLARQLAAVLRVPHIELDALYFGPDLSTVPRPVLRERTRAAVAGERWVTDGNKSAVRDLVWPRADTVVWLDYPLVVSLWRLARRAVWRTSVLTARAADRGTGNTMTGDARTGSTRTGDASTSTEVLTQFLAAARGVITALRSHRGQRRRYPLMFAEHHNQHLAVVRLRSPRATRRWLARISAG